MNSFFYILVAVISTCIVAGKKRDLEDYSDEADDKPTEKYISLRGTIMRSFALTAAIDNRDQNIICSPLSAVLPLGKLAIGAKGETANELLKAVGVARKTQLKSHFKSLLNTLKNLPGVQLDVASRIYLTYDLHLNRKFTHRAQDIFGSSIERLHFRDRDVAADTINNWVRETTHGKIAELISPMELSFDSSLVLVNAIYFSGKWKEEFEIVKEGTFYTPTGTTKVSMMTRYSWYKYFRSNVLGAQLVEIPYQDEGASFVIVLPYKKSGLSAIMSQLKIAPELLDHELNRMRKVKIMLTVPKFKMETEIDLKDVYNKIGISSIFKTKDSELTEIAREQGVFVSSAKQKAIIEVTEFGTEAAAASVNLILGISLDIHREIIECSHPFLFFVRANNQQLFAGTLNNP